MCERERERTRRTITSDGDTNEEEVKDVPPDFPKLPKPVEPFNTDLEGEEGEKPLIKALEDGVVVTFLERYRGERGRERERVREMREKNSGREQRESESNKGKHTYRERQRERVRERDREKE